jgi:hypothetical protein
MNFERDYRLAVKCAADPTLPMSQARILLRRSPDGSSAPFAATLAAAGFSHIDFDGVDEFKQIVRALLCEWLPADATPQTAGAPA